MSSASEGGVRLTAEAAASLDAVETTTHPCGPTTLKGLPGEWDLYELLDLAFTSG